MIANGIYNETEEIPFLQQGKCIFDAQQKADAFWFSSQDLNISYPACVRPFSHLIIESFIGHYSKLPSLEELDSILRDMKMYALEKLVQANAVKSKYEQDLRKINYEKSLLQESLDKLNGDGEKVSCKIMCDDGGFYEVSISERDMFNYQILLLDKKIFFQPRTFSLVESKHYPIEEREKDYWVEVLSIDKER